MSDFATKTAAEFTNTNDNFSIEARRVCMQFYRAEATAGVEQ